MKNVLLPFLLFVCHGLFAQSGGDSFGPRHTGKSFYVAGDSSNHEVPSLFNSTSPTLNTIFNTTMRDSALNRISLSFDYFANSNSIPALIGYKMLFKGEITAKLKDRGDRAIKKNLTFEDNLNGGVDYQHRLKKWDGILYFGYHHRQMRNLSGSKEAYELLFYGNARFEDDTVDLSRIRFQNFIYNQYSFGVKKTFRKDEFITDLGIGLSFLQVMSNQQIRTRDAWLYTAPYGEFLDMKYDLMYNAADEGATPFTEMNGVGVSADFHFSFENRNRWKIALDANDLGSMSFAKNPVNYIGADFVRFQGIELPNLFNFTSATFDTLNIDSALTSNLPDKTFQNYSVVIPFNVSLIYSQVVGDERLVISAGFQYRYLPRYFLYGFLKANFFIKPDMSISTVLGFGGYSKFNLGLEFSKSWKYFDFTLGTGNLIGVVAPAYYPGTGMYLRLGTSF